MGGNLVTSSGDPSNQIRMPLSHPAEHKERRTKISFPKQVKNPFRIPLHSTRKLVPVTPPHGRLKGGYLEVFFNVKGQTMHRLAPVAGHGHRTPSPCSTTRAVSVKIRKSNAMDRFL